MGNVNSFRKISIYPGEDDLKPDPLLKANVIKGSYSSVDSYLEIQFRLFREDYIRPLRESIISYSKQLSEGVSSHFKDIRLYRSVRITKALLTTEDGIVHKVHFRYDGNINWDSSKRLIFGSLICLSVNNFKTMLVATVVSSKPWELRRGEVYIKFIQEHADEAHRLKDRTFVAIETDAYFEAYRHVLSVLQDFHPDRFPLEEYIVRVTTVPRSPTYLRNNMSYCFRGILDFPALNSIEEILYGVRKLDLKDGGKSGGSIVCKCNHTATEITFPVSDLSIWPDEQSFQLDKSQIAAFKSALTQKLSLIQGPPGTGKTHVGLKIVHALLHNQLYQTPDIHRYPILVVCYTNHALDQFLEGVLKITDKVVRVGGRSNSQALEKHNLKYLKQTSYKDFTRAYRGLVRRNLETLIMNIELQKQFREDAKVRLLTEEELKHDIPDYHMSSLLNDHPRCMDLSLNCYGEFIQYWLVSKLPSHFYYEHDGMVYIWMDDMTDEIVQILEDMQYSEFLFNHILRPQGIPEPKPKQPLPLIITEEPKDDQERKPKNLPNISDLQDVTDVDFIKAQRMEEGDILSDARVVYGTSATPKRRTYVSAQIQCEPLSEIEALLYRNVWDLRLPDRWRLYKYWLMKFFHNSQERINTAKAEYETKLKLYDELRLERERLVTEDYDIIGMTTTGAAKYKHLMRSLKPKVVIVEEAAEVQEAHVISSLSENTEHLILIGDHQQLRPNPACYELAKYFGLDVSLFERLVDNGLPFVRLGIQHRMRPCISRLLVPHIYKSLEDHSSVYEYEDILGVTRNVFFLNHSFHENASSTSKCNVFEAEFMIALCKYLVLQGYQPQQITVLATYLAQFALLKQLANNVPIINGAKITVVDNYQGEENDIVLVSFVRSNERGSIGFLKTNNRVCVALSRAKQGLYCIGNFDLLSTESSLWESIVTKLRSTNAIGPALETVCQNHNTKFLVSDAKEFNKFPDGGCDLACNFVLQCGHICTKKCHPRDPQHVEYVCRQPCTKVNESCEFGHVCTRLCFSDCGPCMFKVPKTLPQCLHVKILPCSTSPENEKCPMPCPETLTCGHRCSSTCGEQCPECSSPVSRISPCGHSVTIPCSVADEPSSLLSACREPCVKILDCGHTCTEFCGSQCIKYCHVVQERQLPCGHLCVIPCYRTKESDEELMASCTVPCDSIMTCGHRCKGTCGKCLQGKIHVLCMERCDKELLCGHVVRNILCSKTVLSCKQTCRSRCSHRKCPFPCSCICLPCNSACTWICEHHQCSKLCSEECDRPVCELPCSKLLPCGHRCLGFCGEACPPKCINCDQGNITDLSFDANHTQSIEERGGKLILLENCGHVFECEDLEVWLKSNSISKGNPFTKICFPICPLCKTPLQRSGRLGAFVRDAEASVNNVKHKIFGCKQNQDRKRTILLQELSSLHIQDGLNGHTSLSACGLLNKLNTSTHKKRSTMDVLIGIETCIRICRELHAVNNALAESKRLGDVNQICQGTLKRVVNRMLSDIQNINQQLIYDISSELDRLWSIADKGNAGSECSGKVQPCRCEEDVQKTSKSRRRFHLGGTMDFTSGNWYLCQAGHICCFGSLTEGADILCNECEISEMHL